MKYIFSTKQLAVMLALMILSASSQATSKSTSAPSASVSTQTVKKTSTSNTKSSVSRVDIKSKSLQIAAGEAASEQALSPAELELAQLVHVGRMPCELGAFVTVEADANFPGYFNVEGKGFRYRMMPVATTTGSVRLEDRAGHAVWLQIANKSMLMNKKLGQRLADACSSPEQLMVAESIKKSPPQNIFEMGDTEKKVK